MSTNNRPLLQPGTLIKNKWQIQQKLGSGSFGEIYSAIDTHSGGAAQQQQQQQTPPQNGSAINGGGGGGNNTGSSTDDNSSINTNTSTSTSTGTTTVNNNTTANSNAPPVQVAVKVEKADSKKTILKLEVIAIKHLQSCERVVRYVHSGRHHEVNFLVMEKLGDNLAQLRKVYGKKGRFSMSTTLRLGIQMIECLEGVHRLGYVHRDVKPSNFVINLQPENAESSDATLPVTVHIIDFGLARKFILPNGEIRPPRKSAGFRGTVRYASINSHESLELGPHDDIWSVFYSLVEYATGALPWMKIREKAHVLQLKKRFNNESLVDGLPDEFLLFMKHLQGLKYGNLPDYGLLKGLLMRVCENNGYRMDDLYDWQKKSNTSGSGSRGDVRNPQTSSKSTAHVSRSVAQSSSAQDPNDNFYNIVPADRRPSTKGNSGKDPNRDNQSNRDKSSNNNKKGCRCVIQ